MGDEQKSKHPTSHICESTLYCLTCTTFGCSTCRVILHEGHNCHLVSSAYLKTLHDVETALSIINWSFLPSQRRAILKADDEEQRLANFSYVIADSGQLPLRMQARRSSAKRKIAAYEKIMEKHDTEFARINPENLNAKLIHMLMLLAQLRGLVETP